MIVSHSEAEPTAVALSAVCYCVSSVISIIIIIKRKDLGGVMSK